MHEKIKDIQNAVWKAYKAFAESKNMKQYNADSQAIVKKYADDTLMLNFAQNILISWCPIIHEVAVEGIEKNYE